MSGEGSKPTDWVTMKIDPEIFEELGVRDPEETKREMAISKRVRQVRKELEKDPNNVELQLELASLYIDGREFDDAVTLLKQIISRDNQNGRAYKLLGTAYGMCNHEEEAIHELSRAAELIKDDPEIHFNLGGVFMLKDMYENASRCFKNVIELDPMDTMGYANLAASYDMQKKFDEEILVLKKVLMFSPEDKELRSALSTAYFNAGNYDEALNHALCVVEIDEKDPQAYCNLGSCFSAQSMIDEAVEAFQKATEIDPDYSLPHTNLGSLYATIGRLEKAIKEFKLATSMNRSDALAWLNLYNCYKEVGRLDDAEEAYRTYERLLNEQAPQTSDQSSIPGGVSATGQLASGGNLDNGNAGLEGLSS
ncbi:hypothetical protein UR09_00550 [Candidatus Nitromaritima sp. SCGC AAA799-A02]|nr:hypothetical protein UZ36_07555 [Candidatus Nitromaritima sp. SCGC AAA799-C22]KMP12635.1 hypothetical protein UR09_00550 [Candidatus Nitromaritima sp. SCGC AAA799-A02]